MFQKILLGISIVALILGIGLPVFVMGLGLKLPPAAGWLTVLALPFLDQGGEADLIVPELVAVARQGVAFAGNGLAQRDQFGEVGGQPFGASAQFRHHSAEQHGGAQRLQRIFRAHQQRRRRAAAGALQRGQHLHDLPAA